MRSSLGTLGGGREGEWVLKRRERKRREEGEKAEEKQMLGPVGAAPAGSQRSELAKCKPQALAERSGQRFALRELGAAGKKARQKIKIVIF